MGRAEVFESPPPRPNNHRESSQGGKNGSALALKGRVEFDGLIGMERG